MVGFRGGGGNGSRTETGFIGEDPAGNPFLNGRGNHITEDTAHDALGSEGADENVIKTGRNIFDVEQDRKDTDAEVKNGHERHNNTGNGADLFDTADDDDETEKNEDYADEDVNGRNLITKEGKMTEIGEAGQRSD